jgi:hypothetical protein
MLFVANLHRPHFLSSLSASCFSCGRVPQVSPKQGSNMRAYRVGLSMALAIGGGVADGVAAFAQDNRGTPEQQMACTPDVFRLCGEMIPDVGRITSCLRQKTPLLSGPCRAVFEPASSLQRSAPGARDIGPRPFRSGPSFEDDSDQ